MQKYYKGQTLWCKNGESVRIKSIFKEGLLLEYKGREYRRDFEKVEARLSCELRDIPHQQPPTCFDCMQNRIGECFGSKEICESFKYVPKMDKNKISQWPSSCWGYHYYF